MRGKTWMQIMATIFAARMSGQSDAEINAMGQQEIDFAANVADAIFATGNQRNEDEIKKATEAEPPSKPGLVFDELTGGWKWGANREA